MGIFVKVATAGEISANSGKLVEAGGKQIALFHVEGKYYALDNNCTHRGGPLSEGEVMGAEVECPWHGAHFNLESGHAVRPPAAAGVACYPVRQQGQDIEVEV
ncbi:MAG: non-heme iron oxygenase ferredoxin subunit [Acidobacteria bacterium]|nr:non-heme iron oxygenase ferredoxin subunit [Acidobacteriota bacterium]